MLLKLTNKYNLQLSLEKEIWSVKGQWNDVIAFEYVSDDVKVRPRSPVGEGGGWRQVVWQLKQMTGKLAEDEREERVAGEWRAVAVVLDRLFFWSQTFILDIDSDRLTIIVLILIVKRDGLCPILSKEIDAIVCCNLVQPS